MHPHPSKDAPGADVGDGSVPGAQPIDVIRCPGHPAAVDVVGVPGDTPIHLSAIQWQEFAAKVKAGKYDEIGGMMPG